MSRSADLSLYVLLIQKGILTEEQLDPLLEQAVSHRTSLKAYLTDQGAIAPRDLERILRIRARHARRCVQCPATTYILPGQDPTTTPCEACGGRRFSRETLEVRWKGHSIADILDLTVEEAAALFAHQRRMHGRLQAMVDVGLGYLQLGQSSTTLSGGEAQRVKLAGELSRASGSGPSVVVLDEPSTGLSATDVVHLARSLARIAGRGDAVVLIEHHTELLGICNRLVELGPGGGGAGGRIIGEGTPAQLASMKASVTGPWLEARAPFSSDETQATRDRSERSCARTTR